MISTVPAHGILEDHASVKGVARPSLSETKRTNAERTSTREKKNESDIKGERRREKPTVAVVALGRPFH